MDGVSFPSDGTTHFYAVTGKANSAKTLTSLKGWLLDHSNGSGKVMEV
jgi:hypothetical protein